jgi:hypothetical protein
MNQHLNHIESTYLYQVSVVRCTNFLIQKEKKILAAMITSNRYEWHQLEKQRMSIEFRRKALRQKLRNLDVFFLENFEILTGGTDYLFTQSA